MIKLSEPNVGEREIEAVVNVLRSGQLVHGKECESFEDELSSFLGMKFGVLVSSGTAALHVALEALGMGPGDAVIVPDFTFPATANAVAMTGARVVLVDVVKGTYTMDTLELEKVVSDWCGVEKLRGIIPVHEFGVVANMQDVLRIAECYGLSVVEDAACALGAHHEGKKAGTFGDVGCFSFHPRKSLTTGEGGLAVTDDPDLAARMRIARNHGIEKTNAGAHFVKPSTNYRMTDFQAAMGRQQLPQLEEGIAYRRKLAERYFSCLLPLEEKGYLDLPVWVRGHSWQTFMVVLNAYFSQSCVISKLFGKGVQANIGAQSLSSIGIYGEQVGKASVGPELFKGGLALPLHERMLLDDVEEVVKALKDVLFECCNDSRFLLGREGE